MKARHGEGMEGHNGKSHNGALLAPAVGGQGVTAAVEEGLPEGYGLHWV